MLLHGRCSNSMLSDPPPKKKKKIKTIESYYMWPLEVEPGPPALLSSVSTIPAFSFLQELPGLTPKSTISSLLATRSERNERGSASRTVPNTHIWSCRQWRCHQSDVSPEWQACSLHRISAVSQISRGGEKLQSP
jgi:hypothetical protein